MPISGRLRMTSSRLPSHIETMRPQNSCGWSPIMRGPGCTPWIMKAPSISAMVGLPGMPSRSVGMNAVCEAALLADSGPATPSTAPLPNRSGSLATLFSSM
ncbi:hypothetical protein D3C86_1896720 [compost metagenome]